MPGAGACVCSADRVSTAPHSCSRKMDSFLSLRSPAGVWFSSGMCTGASLKETWQPHKPCLSSLGPQGRQLWVLGKSDPSCCCPFSLINTMPWCLVAAERFMGMNVG